MNLSVVIPAYNEEKDIRQAVFDIYREFPSAEIIIVDDASTDQTPLILNELQKLDKNKQIRVIRNKENRGHGYSVVRGLWSAMGDNILYVDADRQIDLSNFKKIPKENLYLYDVITGQRVHRNDKLFRKVISIGLRYTILLRHHMYIKDSNCPFKVYKRDSLRKLIPQLPKTFVVPIACLEVIARREGMLTGYIPTPHKPYEGTRDGFLQIPNMNFFRFVGKAFKEMVRL